MSTLVWDGPGRPLRWEGTALALHRRLAALRYLEQPVQVVTNPSDTTPDRSGWSERAPLQDVEALTYALMGIEAELGLVVDFDRAEGLAIEGV